jgi:MFS family permease
MNSPKNTITAFYITGGLRELIPIYPLYAVMMGQDGISAFELSILFSIWALTGIITEIPSGAWADTYSRKRLIVAGGFIKGSAFLTWYCWPDFWGYALGFMIWGVGSSIRSGAWEALLYDQLKRWHVEARFTRHYGRIKALATLGAMSGEILGGFLIIYGFDTVLLISAAVPVLATIPFIILVQDIPNNVDKKVSYSSTLMAGVRETFSNRSILYILLTFSFLIVTSGVIDEYVSPIFFEKGFSLSMVAFLAAPIFLAQALGEALASRFHFLSLDQLLTCMAASTLFLIAATFVTGYWLPTTIAVFFFTFGLAGTIFSGQLQQEIEGASRATITSTVSLGDGIGAIVWFMIFGIVAESSTMAIAAGVFGLLTIILCLAFLLLGRNWNITHHNQDAP